MRGPVVDGEDLRGVVPDLEGGSVALEEGERPLAYVLRETEVPENVGHPLQVNIVKEFGYVE